MFTQFTRGDTQVASKNCDKVFDFSREHMQIKKTKVIPCFSWANWNDQEKGGWTSRVGESEIGTACVEINFVVYIKKLKETHSSLLKPM